MNHKPPPAEIVELLRKLAKANPSRAVDQCKIGLKECPGSPAILRVLITALIQCNELQNALIELESLGSIEGDSPYLLSNRIYVLYKLGRLEEAALLAHRMNQSYPHESIGFELCGRVLLEQRNFSQAVEKLKIAIRLGSKSPSAFELLAYAQDLIGATKKALDTLSIGLSYHSDNASLLSNQGSCLRTLGMINRSIKSYYEAIKQNPSFAIAYNGLGVSLLSAGQVETAVEMFDRAITIDTQFFDAISNRNLALNYRESFTKKSIADRHKDFAVSVGESLRRPPLKICGNKIRLGFVSADLRRHSVAYFFRSFLRYYDRTKFEVICYHNSDQNDDITAELRGLACGWREVAILSDEALRSLINQDRITVLCDLSGHSAGNRLPAFSKKSAPIQVTWMGYPNTTGVPAIDYRITDSIADPIGTDEDLYVEKTIRVPSCFLCYSGDESILSRDNSPSEAEGFTTFGSFNHYAKVNGTTLRIWAEILKQTDNSRLIIKNHSMEDASIRRDCRNVFASFGVDVARISLRRPSLDWKAHMSVYNEVDIALDTFPYNGTTTTCEALWMGVPVVTLYGDRHCSRVGASLLTRVNLRQLITHSMEEYVIAASNLGKMTTYLTSLRSSLRTNMKRSSLGNGNEFTREIESIFCEMVNNAMKDSA